MSNQPRKPGLWPRLRRIWVIGGLTATAIFVGWSLIAYRSNAEARAATLGTPGVTVAHVDGIWRFTPAPPAVATAAGLLFFPGSLVDPRAYAPLLLAGAQAGHPALLVELPRRGAFGGGSDPAVGAKARQVMHAPGAPTRWVVAGHSLGGS